jgi:hypothetical protein
LQSQSAQSVPGPTEGGRFQGRDFDDQVQHECRVASLRGEVKELLQIVTTGSGDNLARLIQSRLPSMIANGR